MSDKIAATIAAADLLTRLRRERPDETTYQVIADGDLLADFTDFREAALYVDNLNDDWTTVELVTIDWRYERVERAPKPSTDPVPLPDGSGTTPSSGKWPSTTGSTDDR